MKVLVNSQDKVYLTSGNKALKAKEKCGLTISDFIGDIDENNVLKKPTSEMTPNFSGVEDLGDYALYYRFAGNSNLSSISFPDLTTISGSSVGYYMCSYNINLASVSFPELVTVTGSNALYYAFYGCRITSVTFPKLTTVSGQYSFQNAFGNQTSALTSFSFPELTSIQSGNGALASIFSSCTGLTSIPSTAFPKLSTITSNQGLSSAFSSCSALIDAEFPELTSISAASGLSVFNSTFSSCPYLTTVRFPKLSTIEIIGSSTSGSSFASCYNGCTRLEDIYFNALTTSSFVGSVWQFNVMFNSTTASTSGNVNIHFPSNLQSTIQGLQGYPNFGATAGRVTLLFDLPATN